MMYRTDDPHADYDRYCAEQDKLVARLPVCEDCERHIEDFSAYYINGVWICEDCMESYRREVLPE